MELPSGYLPDREWSSQPSILDSSWIALKRLSFVCAVHLGVDNSILNFWPSYETHAHSTIQLLLTNNLSP
jgi:hypothetical protein